MARDVYSPQKIPVYFPGSARFQNADGVPSGALGAKATVTISINLRPQWFTGIRAWNVYPVGETFQNFNILYLQHLDNQQTMSTELTQSNIVVRDALQPLLLGGGAPAIHWHPFATPYPWGGGDNITLIFTRLTSYPTDVLPTVHVLLEGIMLVRDQVEDGGRVS